MADTTRPCYPEWCESGKEPHDDVCDNAPMKPMTKREFVDFMRAAAVHAVDAYLVMIDEPAVAPAEAKAMAVDEVDEAAVCCAGIGSCGRGWCHHG